MIYATAMAQNLEHAPTTLREPCFNTLDEMTSVASKPYASSNVRFQGDTLDRYRNSVVGNFCESLVVYTLVDYGVDPNTIDICREYGVQVDDKIDIIISEESFQVKKAKIGTFGQLFVSRNDLTGTADHLASVDYNAGKIYVLSRQEFLEYVKREEWSIDGTWKYEYGRPTDAGWYRGVDNFVDLGLCVVLTIPSYLSMPDLTEVNNEES